VPEHTLHALLEELTDLRARVAELEREREDSLGDRREQDSRTARDSGEVSRRRLFGLLGGAATAGGLAVAGSTLGADRAHAADGDALLIGQTNSNDDPGGSTILVGSTTTQGHPVLHVNHFGQSGAAVLGQANNSPGGTGVVGAGSQIGVSGDGGTTGTGVVGGSTSGNGVNGASSSGFGVVGTSTTGNSVAAIGPSPTSPGAHLFLQPGGGVGPPSGGAHTVGQFWVDSAGVLWQCVVTGTPGTWVRQAPFVPLATPSRVYDSRVGQPNPSGSPQGPLAFGDPARTINCSPQVPAGASAILFNVTVTDTAGKFGALVVFSAASPDPSTNSVVWTSPKSTASSSAASACDGSQDVKVKCVASPGCSTEFILDVTGYYT
jgi:hypothetical protein